MSKERDLSLYCLDIFIASHLIERYTQGFENGDELLHHRMHWDATIRQFEIIGEATGKLLKAGMVEGREFRVIVDFRNKIVHEYFGIDEEILFDIVRRGLPRYIETMKSLVKSENLIASEAIEMELSESSHDPELLAYLETLKTDLGLTKQ